MWPLQNKADESRFRYVNNLCERKNISQIFLLLFFSPRTIVVETLNEWSKKYKWRLTGLTIKMQIVLFPGGIEILKILVELSKSAMRKILQDNNQLKSLGEP